MKQAGTKKSFDEAYTYATRNRIDLVQNMNNLFRIISITRPDPTICPFCHMKMTEGDSEYKELNFKGDGTAPPDYEKISTIYECLECGETEIINQ